MLSNLWQVVFLLGFQPLPQLLLTSLAIAASSYYLVAPLVVLLPGLPRAYVPALVLVLSIALYYVALRLRPDLVPSLVPVPLPGPHASSSFLVSTS